PAVIVFGVFFEEASPGPREDEAFAAAISRAGNVLLVQHLGELAKQTPNGVMRVQSRTEPTEVLEHAALATADFPLPRMADERVLRHWTFGRPHDGLPTLPVVAAQVYLADAYDDFFDAFAAAVPDVAADLPGDREALLVPGVLKETMRLIRDAFDATEGLGETLRARLETLPDAKRRERALAV